MLARVFYMVGAIGGVRLFVIKHKPGPVELTLNIAIILFGIAGVAIDLWLRKKAADAFEASLDE